MKLLTFYLINIFFFFSIVTPKIDLNCAIKSIFYPLTGTKTPVITFSSINSKNNYQFTVISKKNKNNFIVKGPIIYSGYI